VLPSREFTRSLKLKKPIIGGVRRKEGLWLVYTFDERVQDRSYNDYNQELVKVRDQVQNQ